MSLFVKVLAYGLVESMAVMATVLLLSLKPFISESIIVDFPDYLF